MPSWDFVLLRCDVNDTAIDCCDILPLFRVTKKERLLHHLVHIGGCVSLSLTIARLFNGYCS